MFVAIPSMDLRTQSASGTTVIRICRFGHWLLLFPTLICAYRAGCSELGWYSQAAGAEEVVGGEAAVVKETACSQWTLRIPEGTQLVLVGTPILLTGQRRAHGVGVVHHKELTLLSLMLHLHDLMLWVEHVTISQIHSGA